MRGTGERTGQKPPHPSMVTSVGSSRVSQALGCLHTSQLLASQEASPRREAHGELFRAALLLRHLASSSPIYLRPIRGQEEVAVHT